MTQEPPNTKLLSGGLGGTSGPCNKVDRLAIGKCSGEEINADDEVEDTCDNKEDDLGAVEEQRSVILHLLSQLKLGMDLTRVSNGINSL